MKKKLICFFLFLKVLKVLRKKSGFQTVRILKFFRISGLDLIIRQSPNAHISSVWFCVKISNSGHSKSTVKKLLRGSVYQLQTNPYGCTFLSRFLKTLFMKTLQTTFHDINFVIISLKSLKKCNIKSEDYKLADKS